MTDKPEVNEASIIPLQPEETYHRPAEDMNVAIPADRRLVINSPGWMNFAQPGGGYPGSRLMTISTVVDLNGQRKLTLDGFDEKDALAFIKQLDDAKVTSPIDAFNLYFKNRANLLTVYLKASSFMVAFAITNSLEGEKLEYFREYSTRIARGMEEWEKERQERQAEEFEAQQLQRKEQERLVTLGKKAEADGVFEQNKKNKLKLKALKAVLFKVGGKEAVQQFEDATNEAIDAEPEVVPSAPEEKPDAETEE